jgi:hypothetical protein
VQIARVRRALGTGRGFLKTVSGRGYRFIAKVKRADEEREGTPQAASTSEALDRERAKRTNLPAPTLSLVDRQAELSEVLRLVAGHRLVTLTGAGVSARRASPSRSHDICSRSFPRGRGSWNSVP